MAIDGKIKPNEDFWINLSAESIYGSTERTVKAGETLKTIITWAFGIFTVGGFALSVFGNNFKAYDCRALYLFGGAFFLLTIAQTLVVKSQAPVMKSYNDVDPVEIKKVFSNAVKAQSSYLSVAMGICFTSFFLLALGILFQFASLAKKEEVKNESVTLTLKTGVEKRTDTTSIPVTVHFKAKEPIQITIINLSPMNGENNKPLPENSPERLMVNSVFYTDSDGKMYYSYSFKNNDLLSSALVKVTSRQKDSTGTMEELSKLVALKIRN